MSLRSIGTGVNRCPFIVGTLRLQVKELHLEDALVVVLVFRTFTEVVAEFCHQFVLTIQLVTTIGSTHDILENGQSLAILVAHHQCTGIVAGSGTTGGATFCPLAANSLGRQQRHSFCEVLLNMIEHAIILSIAISIAFLIVGSIQTVQSLIIVIICNQSRILIVASQIIVSQTTNEQGLSLDALIAVTQRTVVIGNARQDEITYIDGVVPVTPRPLVDFVSDRVIQIVEWHIPNLRRVPYFVTTGDIKIITHAGVCALHADVVVASNDTFFQIIG